MADLLEDKARTPARVRCAKKTEMPPRSQKLLKIVFEGYVPDVGIIEPVNAVFKEKQMIVPYSLTEGTPVEHVLMVNLTCEKKILNEGDVIGEVHEAQRIYELEKKEIGV